MLIREYQTQDKDECLAVFDSNYPRFFDKTERDPFVRWLDHRGAYTSPAYKNAVHDAYYVVEEPGASIVGCGGFYITAGPREARLAWGMIHASYHRSGYGTALYRFRTEVIQRDWPDHAITLGTSQHTYPFYQKMGMHVLATIRAGYGPDLDRYDMVQ